MASELIHDSGRGPEIRGTRITIYDLLPYFLDPSATEEYIAKIYDLTGEQVAAARASVFENADTVFARHLEIEKRLSTGNPPEVTERARSTRQNLISFREWLVKREAEDRETDSSKNGEGHEPAKTNRPPTFKEWLEKKESRPVGDA